MRLSRDVLVRGCLVLLGLALVGTAAIAAIVVAANGLGPSPGDHATYREEVRYWTPGDGWQHAVRERSSTVHESPGGLEVQETLEPPHSPRGRSFELAVDPGFHLRSENGLRAALPPTPYLQEPLERVYLAVPWEVGDRATPGAVDNLTLTGPASIGELEVLGYEAHHQDQFYVTPNGEVWFRAVDRTALVEPLTGTLVDYTIHETLWRQGDQGPAPALPLPVDVELSEREPVWEAIINPTPATVNERVQAAEEARQDHHIRMALYGLGPLLLGEMAVFAGFTGRLVPKQWMDAEAKV